eukprot:Gb_19282 [translate_table: standard]
MALASSPSSTMSVSANANAHSHTRYSKTPFLKSNSKSKFISTTNTWRHKIFTLRIFSQTTSTNPQTKTPSAKENPSLADQLKPFAQEFLEPKPSANIAHHLDQGVAKPKSSSLNPSKPRKSTLSMERRRRSKIHTWSPRVAELRLFAQKLEACGPTQEAIFEALDSLDETPNPKDAMIMLNNVQSWEKAYIFFQWLKNKEDFELNVVAYNVTMKALRKGKQWDLVEELLQDMLGRGIEPDNITYSTVISCARRCDLPHKAVEWFERMYETGCVPDEVTYTAMIDAYGRAGKVQEALNLYERARADGWRPDAITFSTLVYMYGSAGDCDSAFNSFQEMKALGVQPNVVTYNTMLDALAKVGRPSMARAVFNEMMDAGLTPNQVTLTALIRIYGRARWADDALKLWAKMKEEGWGTDLILYNTLLSMCADIGRVEEALMLFEEMGQSQNCKPDIWSYTSMINLYTSKAQVEEANNMLDKMMEAGFRPNVMICTCLLDCYGKVKRFDDVVRTFNLLLDEGIFPDDKFCGCLLAVVADCEKEELGKVLRCLEKINPKLGLVVNMLQEEEISFADLREELRTVFNQASDEVRKPFCNALIDLCCKLNFPERAHELLYLGTLFGIYTGLHTKSPTEWCLHVRSLSFGAALTAFQGWVSSLSKALEEGEELPPLLGIHTGHGNHKVSSDQGLAAFLESHLKDMDSPFQESTERVGWFFANREAVASWLQSRNLATLTTA